MTKSKSIRIVYLGTPEISAALLEKLINLGLNTVGVVAQPDKPAGRKRLVLDVPTKVVAKNMVFLYFNLIELEVIFLF